MTDALARLAASKRVADADSKTRGNYAAYISAKREEGWADADVEEYGDAVKTLMTGSDEEALALYPAGVFSTAEEARAAAREFWAGLNQENRHEPIQRCNCRA